MFSKPTIFPLSQYPRIDQCIIAYLGVDDRLKLSQVSKTAQAFLSNNYFKELFLERVCKGYPALKNLFSDSVVDKNINYLINSYPNNCWKVFCWVFSKPARNFPADKLNISYYEIKQNLLNSWKSQIEEILPSENKKICGSHYEDPNSEIHKAWILYKDFKTSYFDLKNGFALFLKDQCPSMDEYLIEVVREFIETELDQNKFNEIKELSEKIKTKLKENINTFLLELNIRITDIQNYEEIIEKCSNFGIDLTILKLKMKPYENLESKRIQIEDNKRLFSCLINSNKDINIETFEKIHESKLFHIRNLLFLKIAQNYLCTKPSCSIELSKLTELLKLTSWGKKSINDKIDLSVKFDCLKNISIFISKYTDQTKKALKVLDANILPEDKLSLESKKMYENIRKQINEFPANLPQNIWKELWKRCANGKIEDNWSEYHFHEHLDTLCDIISYIISEYIDKIIILPHRYHILIQDTYIRLRFLPFQLEEIEKNKLLLSI